MAHHYKSNSTSDHKAGRTWAMKKDGTTSAGRSSWMLSGMSASHFEHKGDAPHTGLFSILDSDARNKNERKIANMQTSISLSMKNSNGALIKNGTVKLGGHLLMADESGDIRLIDEPALAYQRRLREEADSKLNTLLDYALTSDATCQDLLGWTPKTYEKWMQAGPPGITDAIHSSVFNDLPLDILSYEGRVRVVSLYPENHIKFREGVAKIKAILSIRRPNLINETGTSEEALLNQEDPDK